MTSAQTQSHDRPLQGKRIAFRGRLRLATQSQWEQLVRGAGGLLVAIDEPADLLVVGEGDVEATPADWGLTRFGDSAPEVLDEAGLWTMLAAEPQEGEPRQLYTPAMVAELVGVSLATIRNWQRRGLISPCRIVQNLAYFDFQEVSAALLLSKLSQAGASTKAIQDQLGKLRPHADRPLTDLSVLVDGRKILVRSGADLVEPGGQLRIDFGALEDDTTPARILDLTQHRLERLAEPEEVKQVVTAEELKAVAAQLEEAEQLEAAIEAYRSFLVGYGATAEVCFFLAELLYRVGDLSAARERYYMAIELNESHVEARANLGCVLVELGDLELAAAAFRGALRFHAEYPDAHFHLARLLDQMKERAQAEYHWRTFLRLAPQSPWAEEARLRLELES
ncbi:MAG: MerR family transcriptional regulator [Pirellulaceae bacterium]|nr:MerR family transcriptional regulator [Planctomycetales bacterium]